MANKDKIVVYFVRNAMTQSSKDDISTKPCKKILPEEVTRIESLVKDGAYPKPDIVYTSNVKRCIQTAQIIYKNTPAIVLPELNVPDYNKSYGATKNQMEIYKYKADICNEFEKIVDSLNGTSLSKVSIVIQKAAIKTILRKYVAPRSITQNFNLAYAECIECQYIYDRKMLVIL